MCPARSRSDESRIVELYGIPTERKKVDWRSAAKSQQCPYIARKCQKIRKSTPDQTLGTCTVLHGSVPIVICPIRFRERHQVLIDCIHLLTQHEAGNELHAVTEVEVPGGKIDFMLVSVRDGKAKDFVGIELQTLDTTGSWWPARQHFLASVGVPVDKKGAEARGAGMNWKMSAKTILMQLHHKIQTFEHLGKKIVVVVQGPFMAYMEKEFSFGHLSNPALVGDAAHFHAYDLVRAGGAIKLALASRKSTDTAGISSALELGISARVELEMIVATLEKKLSERTRLSIPVS